MKYNLPFQTTPKELCNWETVFPILFKDFQPVGPCRKARQMFFTGARTRSRRTWQYDLDKNAKLL